MFNRYTRKFGTAVALSAVILSATSAFSGPAVFAAEGAAVVGTPYQANGTYDRTVPHLLINQAYGGGLKTATDTYASHGFIELYNPTDTDINLAGWTLQYADRDSGDTGPTKAWEKLELSGEIKAHSSFLIVGKATGATSPTLNLSGKADLTWDHWINNKGFKVALIQGTDLITDVNPFDTDGNGTKAAGYVDMVGTATNDGGDMDGYETGYVATGISKKKAIRRIDLADTDINNADFEQIDYSSASAATIAEMGPRSSADGAWGQLEVVTPPSITTQSLPDAVIGVPYSATIAASGGTTPYTFSADGLPQGLSIDPATGVISGTASGSEEAAVTIQVSDASSPALTDSHVYTLRVAASAYQDQISVTQIGTYSVGVTDPDGGVAEIVKYNKDNGKFYLVNGSSDPASLDIVSLAVGDGSSLNHLVKEHTINVEELADTDGFEYGDLTSVDINTNNKRVYLSVQEKDPTKNGRILALDYDGNLMAAYEAGVQPDMIKSTPDGKYVLTANEGEPREGIDPKGSVTILDTAAGTVTNAEFDNEAIIDDNVHIRGASDPDTGIITGSGTKADALYDLEPEYIALSGDALTAYVSLQENNAIATLDLKTKQFTAVNGLGLKDLSLPRNSLDLLKDGQIKLENVPFFGVYMPDGIASYTVDGHTYVVSANEGDATDWPGRTNAGKISSVKSSLDPDSAAAQLVNSTTTYDGVEVMTDMGTDSLYMFGGRSFSIWDASTMAQTYDSGNDFEKITAERIPDFFNSGHDKTAMDDRSSKKGPEPEDVKVGQVGERSVAFVGLERIGGVMMYDVTDPANATFLNYTNSRVFTPKNNLNTDTGPEGIEFIPADISPTGQPLLLVAYEVSGTVAVFQLNVSKLSLDKASLSLTAGSAAGKLTATVVPAAGSSSDVTWASSNTSVAKVDNTGKVTPVGTGTAVIKAVSADKYATASATVTVAAAAGGVIVGSDSGSGSDSSSTGNEESNNGEEAVSEGTVKTNTSDGTSYTTFELPSGKDADGSPQALLSADLVNKALEDLNKAGAGNKQLVIHAEVSEGGSILLAEDAVALLADLTGVESVSLETNLGTIALEADAWKSLLSSIGSDGKGSITLKLTSEAGTGSLAGQKVVHFHLLIDGKEVNNVQGGIVVGLPYQLAQGANFLAVVPYAVLPDGSSAAMILGIYDEESGQVVFRVDSLDAGFAAKYNDAAFSDTNNSFASNAITYLAARGIIGGVGGGQFAPGANLTRGDFVLMLSRIAGVQPGEFTGSSFNDVKADAYYAQAVEWASSLGIVTGTGNGAFEPTAEVTREQLVTMLVRFLGLLGYELQPVDEPISFADADSISGYAADSVAAAQQAGLVSGRPTAGGDGVAFAPQASATRAETAKLLALLLLELTN
ncbi:S-layer family protein [Paenibacillus cellulosilyticus]|uniref:S-layer family protein n=1 Tax=Paenibacillus cellulosilyticus TaxID=375489 RepID=A0A2V2YSP4_9BACL|nr:choice-of-anchor I family protein [Paenibacillus cellulosilyticus]PWV98629.1 S-layer family protein [Paenibacillus cellulosilyticus]QKS43854.1 S-layer homology domain-containing protein [Paenibacillus cellulosilyticus]